MPVILSILIAYLFLGLPPSSSAEDKPKIRCAVVDQLATKYENGSVSADKWREVEREATPREAGRVAANQWRRVQKKSNNKDLGTAWLERFFACLEVSGLPFSEIVENKAFFRHLATRSFWQKREEILEDAQYQDVKYSLGKFKERMGAWAKFDADFTDNIQKLAVPPEKETALIEQGNASAEEERKKCGAKDLSAELGPVRDQADIGWCYAFVSAELAGFKAKRGGVRISPSDIAFRYNRKFLREEAIQSGVNTSDQEAGYVGKALQAILPVGFCSESDAPSEDFGYGSIKDTINEIENFKIEAMAGRERADNCFAYNRVTELFPGLPFDDFMSILTVAGDRNLEFFEKMSDKNCEGKRSTFGIKPEMIHALKAGSENLRPREVVQAIDTQLDKNNISGIEVSMELLEPGRTSGHALTVVGRKFDEKSQSCKYLLRNSWGPGCSSGFHGGICAEDHSGHVWVEKMDLVRNLWGAAYIE